MGYLDRFIGGGRKKAEESGGAAAAAEPSTSASASHSSTPELMQDTASRSHSDVGGLVAPSHLGMLGAAGAGGLQLPSMAAGRLYDPYEGITASVGGRKQAFKLNEQLEFVFEEEAAVRRRGWTENLQFYTGMGYVTGKLWGGGAHR